jgi:hypothetical protein
LQSCRRFRLLSSPIGGLAYQFRFVRSCDTEPSLSTRGKLSLEAKEMGYGPAAEQHDARPLAWRGQLRYYGEGEGFDESEINCPLSSVRIDAYDASG